MPWRIAAAASVLAAGWVAPARAETSVCPSVWPPTAPLHRAAVLDASALLKLRDVGHSDLGIGGASPLAVSPDGRQLAFFVSQAVPAVNDSCETLVILELDDPSSGRVLDSGGSGIRIEEVLRGVRRPSGIFDVNIPVWSPDSQTLVYRKRVAGRTQVWRASLVSGPPAQVSQSAHDVEAVGWSRDGKRVLFTVRPGRGQMAAAYKAESHGGYLYDARILPHLAPRPQLPADLPEVLMAVALGGGMAWPASPADQVDFVQPVPLGGLELGPAVGPQGASGGADPIDATYFAPRRVWAQVEGRRIDCADPACTGAVRAVWWHRGELMFLAREGWHRETSAICAWSPRSGSVRPVVRTGEAVAGCVGGTMAGVVCLVESARVPRRIVAFDRRDGGRRVLFDPNPEIEPSALPRVDRLRWRNSVGLEAWGDLVVPNGKRPAEGWPLVVVQYTSEGFLRGGTGDEYPIFPLAERGIAVLSFQRPQLVASLRQDIDDVPTMVGANLVGWADRRSVHDSLMRGLDLAIARGDIDRGRIGISGLSDGSTTARFALINDNRFAAAAISSCCIEPHSALTYGGLAQGDWFRSLGYPKASTSNVDFWRPMSLAMDAASASTPLLMQLADDEYLQALETFDALRDHGQPVEMYVFPGEHHNKWQPLHRAAIYERNLDWFSYWLQDRADANPAKTAQYRRWEAMKAGLQAKSAPEPRPALGVGED